MSRYTDRETGWGAGEQSPKGRKKSPLWRRLLLRLFILGVLLGLLGGAGFVGLFYYYSTDSRLPRIFSIQDYTPKLVTRILDRNGQLISELSQERRTVVPYRKMPPLLIKAVLSAEDSEFFKHSGLNYLGMLRAFFVNLRAGRFAQGGSTITQQVVKTFFLSPERTIRRKVQEVILARRIETELSKEEILYLYLNQIYLGHGRYGVQEASRFFFGKDVDKLGIGEIALLAGLPQSPERLSPLKHPDQAKRRQLYVLGRMAALGHLSADAARKVGEASIEVVKNVRPYFNESPEFVDRVREDLVKTFGEEKLSTMGLTVTTTLDAKLQAAAREALQVGLRALDARQGYRRAASHVEGKKLARTLERLKKEQEKIEEGRRYRAIVASVDDQKDELVVDLGVRKGRVLLSDDQRYNPQGDAASKRFAAGDLVWVRAEKIAEEGAGPEEAKEERLRFDGGPQGALVVIDPRTGDLLALVGGYEFEAGEFDRALRARRQPGSAFKPVVYAAALDSGKVTAATILEDAPVVIGTWSPKNYDGTYRGHVRLREALAHSLNTVAARLIDQVGVEPVRSLAASLGVSSPLGKDASLCLGTSEVTPLELARVYATIANGGARIEPAYLLKIGAQVVRRTEPKPALRPEVAFVLTSLMRSVVEEGTGRLAKKLRRPVAGKTGTTNSQVDAWFAGFSPQLVAVVWVGFDDNRPLGKGETGTRAALPIWVRFMQEALKGKPRLPFKQPPGVVVQRIDPATGLLAPEGATDVLEEYFVQGTEPKEVARPPDQVSPDTILMNPSPPSAP
jgi:penicillin-binding protein 1A